jgi:hypothetical protein
MIRFSVGKVSLFALVAMLAIPAMALNVVNTSAPAINCVFTTASPCSITVTDYVATFATGGSGSGRLQSRIFQGQPGSTAAGKYVYEYRVDMTQVAGITYIPYADEFAVYNYGPLLQYDYNFDSVATDHVYNVTSGGLGTKGVTSATVSGSYLYFFLNPVGGGNYVGGGESSYFFGVVSDYPPTLRTVWVHTDTGWVSMSGYAPQYP